MMPLSLPPVAVGPTLHRRGAAASLALRPPSLPPVAVGTILHMRVAAASQNPLRERHFCLDTVWACLGVSRLVHGWLDKPSRCPELSKPLLSRHCLDIPLPQTTISVVCDRLLMFFGVESCNCKLSERNISTPGGTTPSTHIVGRPSARGEIVAWNAICPLGTVVASLQGNCLYKAS